MKFKVLKNITSEKLLSVVPRRYRELVSMNTKEPAVYAVLLFRHDRKDVVLSRVVNQALSHLGDVGRQKVIAIGGCFTAESQALLKDRGIEFYQLSDFHWTDASYTSI